MANLIKVEARPNFTLYLVFEDGTEGEVCLADRIWGPAFDAVRDPAVFAAVSIDEFGAPMWPGGADWAPDALYRELRAAVDETASG